MEVQNSNYYGLSYIEPDEIKEVLLDWQKQNLSYTSSGYMGLPIVRKRIYRLHKLGRIQDQMGLREISGRYVWR